MSDFNFPYISCLLYFGANTIWYWHLHFECDKLPMSFKTKPPFDFDAVGRPASSIAKGGFLLSKDSHSPSKTGGLFSLKRQSEIPVKFTGIFLIINKA